MLCLDASDSHNEHLNALDTQPSLPCALSPLHLQLFDARVAELSSQLETVEAQRESEVSALSAELEAVRSGQQELLGHIQVRDLDSHRQRKQGTPLQSHGCPKYRHSCMQRVYHVWQRSSTVVSFAVHGAG